MIKSEPADAQNAAITLWSHVQRHWRGVCDPVRWTFMAMKLTPAKPTHVAIDTVFLAAAMLVSGCKLQTYGEPIGKAWPGDKYFHPAAEENRYLLDSDDHDLKANE